ncbi:hypothetical protein OAF09_01600 [bacterium]|nr:hypothetical protein [Rhodopirellula sp.]MDB4676902.1 hypothetical protein [bacterium]MDB4679004.1 hypothetical protein [Rhodopirellula sp.]
MDRLLCSDQEPKPGTHPDNTTDSDQPTTAASRHLTPKQLSVNSLNPSSLIMTHSQETQTDPNPHTDKYNDPRVTITRRGIFIAIGVSIFAILGAAASIIGRRTQLEKTRQFWGETTIIALQLGERVELRPRGNESFETVELSGTPGLGHLRRLLLDERNYDWTTVSDQPALGDCGEPIPRKPRCVQLRLTDPTANRFEIVEIDLDLQTGWVGASNETKRIKVLERTQPKLQKYFETTITVEQLRSDFRND